MRTERNRTEKRKRRRQSRTRPRFFERLSRTRAISISKAKTAPTRCYKKLGGRSPDANTWMKTRGRREGSREDGARGLARSRYEEIAPRSVDDGGGSSGAAAVARRGLRAHAGAPTHEKLHLFAWRSVSAPHYFCFKGIKNQ